MRSIWLATLAMAMSGCAVEERTVIVKEPARSQPQVAPPARPAPPPAPVPVAAPTPAPAPGNTETYEGHAVPVVRANSIWGGEHGAFRGWVFFISNRVNRFPDLTSQIPRAVVFTNDFNVGAQTPTTGFPGIDSSRNDWFAIRYEGRFTTRESGQHNFEVISDDGANFYVDGNIVVVDDGLHPGEAKHGVIALNPGTHTFKLDYFQGPGQVRLQVYVQPPGHAKELWAPRI